MPKPMPTIDRARRAAVPADPDTVARFRRELAERHRVLRGGAHDTDAVAGRRSTDSRLLNPDSRSGEGVT